MYSECFASCLDCDAFSCRCCLIGSILISSCVMFLCLSHILWRCVMLCFVCFFYIMSDYTVGLVIAVYAFCNVSFDLAGVVGCIFIHLFVYLLE